MIEDEEQAKLDLKFLKLKIDLETFEPSQRNVLYLIDKYPVAFSVAGLSELRLKFYSKELPSNVYSLQKTAMEMAEKGLIETGLARTTITAKGRWYQFYSHPANWIWAIIIATALTFVIDKLTSFTFWIIEKLNGDSSVKLL